MVSAMGVLVRKNGPRGLGVGRGVVCWVVALCGVDGCLIAGRRRSDRVELMSLGTGVVMVTDLVGDDVRVFTR